MAITSSACAIYKVNLSFRQMFLFSSVITTVNTNIFCVSTVVYEPLVVITLINLCLISSATEIIKDNSSTARPIVCRRMKRDIFKSEINAPNVKNIRKLLNGVQYQIICSWIMTVGTLNNERAMFLCSCNVTDRTP